MKLATWNVNSLNVRLPRLLDWLAAARPDVVCLQETKMEDAKFPRADSPRRATPRTSPGSAPTTASRCSCATASAPSTDVVTALPGFADEQKRVIAATVAGMRIVDFYVPNGQSVDSDKYRYKLDWCRAATAFLAGELARHPRARGDGRLQHRAGGPRRPRSRSLARAGAVLGARARGVPRLARRSASRTASACSTSREKTFSWWDYRQLAFPKNHGLRIDHILLSPALAPRCTACRIDRNARKGERPSDHAPVIAEIAP